MTTASAENPSGGPVRHGEHGRLDEPGRHGEPERQPGTGQQGASIDAEELAGHSFPYQHDLSLVEEVDLVAATPGADLNWLEDIELLVEDGTPAVFDRYSNSFLKIYFPIPPGRENDVARRVLITHLRSGNSYGIQLKERHAKFAQPELGPWIEGSRTVGERWTPPQMEGWEPPGEH